MNRAKLIIDGLGKTIDKNSPTILMAAGIIGMCVSIVMAAKAAPKAEEMVKEATEEKNRELNPDPDAEVKAVATLDTTEKLIVEAKVYWPTAVVAVLSIGCIIFGNNVNLKRNAALLAAYQLAEGSLKDYQDKMIKTLGDKKVNEVKDNIAKDKVIKNPPIEENIISTGHGEYLCMDAVSGRYFRSNIEFVRQAVNNINRKILNDDGAYLNEFYSELCLPGIAIGEHMGWNIHTQVDRLDVDYTSVLTDKGVPCMVINYELYWADMLESWL